MATLNWKIAAAGGAVLGLSAGGFALAGADDPELQPVRDVDLQSARDSISSLSSPIRITPPTTAPAPPAPPAPPPAPAANDSVRSASPAPPPPPAPAPAPAPVFDDSASASSPVQPAPSGGGDSASFSGGGSGS